MLRNGRRWLTAKAAGAAHTIAPILPFCVIDAAEYGLANIGPIVPVLSRTVATNMRAAGLHDEAVVREYFRQVARHLTNAMRVFRLGSDRDGVERLARSQTDLDESISHIERAMAGDKGVVIAPAHVCNYALWVARLNQKVPICIYLRWSKDRRKREMKEAWARATGVPIIQEPASAADPASRVRACVKLLRGGRALLLTPDIVQKADKGVEVRILGHRPYLAAGPATLAMLAKTALVPVFGRFVGQKQALYACEPIHVEPAGRGKRDREAAIRKATQSWGRHFETFLRDCPQAWFFWGDKRWTKVFQGDPRFTKTPTAPREDADAAADADLTRRGERA